MPGGQGDCHAAFRAAGNGLPTRVIASRPKADEAISSPLVPPFPLPNDLTYQK